MYAVPSCTLSFSSFLHSVLTGHLLCQSGLGVVEHRVTHGQLPLGLWFVPPCSLGLAGMPITPLALCPACAVHPPSPRARLPGVCPTPEQLAEDHLSVPLAVLSFGGSFVPQDRKEFCELSTSHHPKSLHQGQGSHVRGTLPLKITLAAGRYLGEDPEGLSKSSAVPGLDLRPVRCSAWTVLPGTSCLPSFVPQLG